MEARLRRARSRRGGVIAETPEARRARHLKATYGITIDEYEALLAAQDGRCAVCGKDPGGKPLNVDHDHKSGLVRGLLCYVCNKIRVGRERDPEMLASAAAYLRFPPALQVLGERVVPSKPKKKRRRRR